MGATTTGGDIIEIADESYSDENNDQKNRIMAKQYSVQVRDKREKNVDVVLKMIMTNRKMH